MSEASEMNNNVSNDNAATLQALGRAYATLVPQHQQQQQQQGNNNNGTGGGFPFGIDASALLGASPATAVAAIASIVAKQLSQQQQGQQAVNSNNNNNGLQLPQAVTGGLTPQQISVLSAALGGGHQHGSTSPAASISASSLLSANTMSQASVQALLKSVVGGNMAAFQVQQQQPPTPSPASSYTPPPFQQQQPQQQHQQHHQQQSHSQANLTASHGHVVPPSSAQVFPNNGGNWTRNKLEQQVKLMQQMKQPVPQSMALLLADARRKDEKKQNKRAANRKSASSSRARKKALVEEMTRTNQRLRRQAMILSLLPDMVICVGVDGGISFCSAQVERTLNISVDELNNASIYDIVIPESRGALKKLVEDLVAGKTSTKSTQKSDGGEQPKGANAENKPEANGNESGEASSGGGSGGVSSAAVAVVSNQSFPMEVVKVNALEQENDDSDASGGGKGGPVISSLSNSVRGSDPEDGTNKPRKGNAEEGKERLSPTSKSHSSDDSSSGSGTSENKNVRKANENLERNVRWHNKKLQKRTASAKSKSGHKDDVLGDSVIPNNASANLSSLAYRLESEKSSKKRRAAAAAAAAAAAQYDSTTGERSSPEGEDGLMVDMEDTSEEKKKERNNDSDSGYKESNESRDETSSCASDSSNSNGKSKPLAPTCNVCLIRDDLTSLWCEVTFSMRTRNVEGEAPEEDTTSASSANVGPSKDGKKAAESKAFKTSTVSADDVSEEPPTHEVKELLLCLRPIGDGDKVDPSLRFAPGKSFTSSEEVCSSPIPSGTTLEVPAVAGGPVSESSTGEAINVTEGTDSTPPESSSSSSKGPPKKRHLQSSDPKKGSNSKRICLEKKPDDMEKSVVESLMLMSNKST